MARKSEAHKRKIGEANAISLKGLKKSDEHRKNIKLAALARPKKSCRVCGKSVSVNAHKQHEIACAKKAEAQANVK